MDNMRYLAASIGVVIEEEEQEEEEEEGEEENFMEENEQSVIAKESEGEPLQSLDSATSASMGYDTNISMDRESDVLDSMISRDGDAISTSRAHYIESVISDLEWSTSVKLNPETENLQSVDIVQFTHDNYAKFDEDLKKHLETAFAKKDKLKLVMKCEVVQHLNPSPMSSLLVVSTDTLYIIKIRGVLSRQALSQSLHLIHEVALSSLSRVEHGFGGQSFRIEAGPLEPSFKILIRDEKRCKLFLKPFTVILMNVAFNSDGELQRISGDRLTSQLILRDVFGQNGPLKSSPGTPDAASREPFPYIRLYIMAHQVIGKPQTGEFIPVSIIVTRSHVVMATELHHLQRLKDVSGNTPTLKQLSAMAKSFEVKDSQCIKDIKSVDPSESHSCDVSVTYGKTPDTYEYTWRLTMATEYTRDTFVTMLTDPCQEMRKSLRMMDSL